MKKAVIAVLSLFFLKDAWAQEEASPAFVPSYTVKWNPGSLSFGKIGFLGEYNFRKKKSFTFGIGIPVENTVSFKLDDEKESLSTKSFSVMAGYRMYLGRKTITGVYFEPYVKYAKNEVNFRMDGELGGDPVVFLTNSSYKGFGLGAQLGVQFMVAKRVSVDFFFLGPEANTARHSVLMRDITSTMPWDAQDAADAEEEINDTLGDIPVIGDKINVKVDPNARTVSSEYKGFLPGLRFGLSLGVHF